MKSLLSVCACWLAAAVSLFGQGYINFANVGAGIGNARIFDGCTGELLPAGPAYSIQLFYANGITSDASSLVAIDDPPVHFAAPGVFNGGGRLINGITPGGVGSFQIRVWATALGGNWEQALTSWHSGPRVPGLDIGMGNVFQVTTKDGTIRPLPTPASLVGQHPFDIGPLTCVPEPTPAVLGLVTLAALAGWIQFRKGR